MIEKSKIRALLMNILNELNKLKEDIFKKYTSPTLNYEWYKEIEILQNELEKLKNIN